MRWTPTTGDWVVSLLLLDEDEGNNSYPAQAHKILQSLNSPNKGGQGNAKRSRNDEPLEIPCTVSKPADQEEEQDDKVELADFDSDVKTEKSEKEI